jgi:hypothetical protein
LIRTSARGSQQLGLGLDYRHQAVLQFGRWVDRRHGSREHVDPGSQPVELGAALAAFAQMALDAGCLTLG